MRISPRRRQSPVLSGGLTNLAGGRQLLLSPPVDVAAPHRGCQALDSATPFALIELERIPDRAGEPREVERIALQRCGVPKFGAGPEIPDCRVGR